MTKKVSKMKLEIIAAVNETTAAMIEINQIAVLRSANPKTTRSLTIHGPGLGKKRASPGSAATAR
ncbi:hypothetical protein Aam_148_004 [Acidocella aminolytica 101 = DSM 11237]|uniref:Uncharacterized protein n=1 Tax=Acidocella aminolytica 101 = DSM 11237 TaxID=1120923 RepID=A0A0D6PLE4_9PROT|nr:hypothetical protein Aam_148_004 [Acidocella aminolytica 101 = DSM 11237]GBQ42495.1 hypothetical protein AA11237_2987 [Acidocella aminolytica 101 = DSM 11237]